jgi:alpha-1,2-mannosyltransferase
VGDVAGIWRRTWRVLVLLVLAGGIYWFLTWAAVRHGFFDLRVYYGAINYWVHDHGPIYDFILARSTYGFTYPPFAAVTMLPMAALPWSATILISLTASVLAGVVLLYWLVDPVARREGWTRWYALGIAICFAAAFEPLRETILFGQVNLLLVFVVALDLLFFVAPGRRFGGIGIGLATAVKLTPGVFILYLLVTRRWRAAIMASATAAAATVFAAVVAPDASRIFWTDAFWNTDRVGSLAFISNQSLEGAVARLHPDHPSTLLWVVTVLAVGVVWFRRVRACAVAGDEWAGFALTGVFGCLLSPVTWIHHLVWVGPALILVLDRGLRSRGRRRVALLSFGVATYVVLCSRLVWAFSQPSYQPVGWFMSSAYVWLSIALLVVLPIRSPAEVAATGVAGQGREAIEVPQAVGAPG